MLPIINGVGTLTREPELKYTSNGKPIVNFGLAFNDRYKDKSGQQKENVTFVDCTIFGALGEKVVIPYVNKGSKIYIVGKLVFQQWTAQDGTNRSKHVITVENLQMLDTKADSQGQAPQQQSQYAQPQGQGYSQPQPNQGQGGYGQPSNTTKSNSVPSVPEIDIDDDEIPF